MLIGTEVEEWARMNDPRAVQWLDAAVGAGACKGRVAHYRQLMAEDALTVDAIDSGDAAWVLIYGGREVPDRADLESLITDSYYAACVLVKAAEVVGRAAMEDRITDSYYAAWVLVEARAVVGRARLEGLITSPADAAWVLVNVDEFADRARLERVACE